MQIVSTVSQRKMVIRWMIEQQEELGCDTRIAARAVDQFPTILRNPNRSVNREKARNWWVCRANYFDGIENAAGPVHTLGTSRRRGPARLRIQRKALTGRGRKRKPWKLQVHQHIREEFERLQSAGVKVTRRLLREIAVLYVSETNIV